jgi:hypothetical protein
MLKGTVLIEVKTENQETLNRVVAALCYAIETRVMGEGFTDVDDEIESWTITPGGLAPTT